MKMHWVKEHGRVLAACDEEIIGKTFKEEELTLTINEAFYKGRLVTSEELVELLSIHSNINLAGKQTIKTAEQKRMIKKVIKVEGVPYAVVFKI